MDCDWNNPGALPARGLNVATMIAHYGYPKSDIAELVEKIRSANNDGTLVITKDKVKGLGGTAYYFGDMHDAKGLCYGSINTSKWPEGKEEHALVYCSINNNCVAIPVVCGNVTRVIWGTNTKELKPSVPTVVVNKVPISSTLWLVGLGLLLLAISRKKVT